MSHTTREKAKLLARIRRIRGQVEALEHALEGARGCAEVLQQIAAVRGAINGLMVEVMQEHIEGHLLPTESDAKRRQGAAELIEVMRTYLR
ncbi:MAG: metal/formaldehyde-sensitive transcriptional repressor [Steroidobacteraceae bacterium]